MMKVQLLAPVLMCYVSASAQTIAGVVAPERSSLPGEAVLVSVQLSPSGEAKPWCGLSINFGDGKAADQRVEDISRPLALSHVYDAPGTYQIKVEGKTLVRGLRTAGACEGGSKVATVRVLDPEQQRRAAEAADNDRKLRDAEAKRRELEAREEELRAREADIRARELRAREAALNAREADIQRKADAARPAPRPVALPASAAGRKDSTLDVFK